MLTSPAWQAWNSVQVMDIIGLRSSEMAFDEGSIHTENRPSSNPEYDTARARFRAIAASNKEHDC